MQLYQYQIDYLKTLPPSCIMAADLGTGKTIMSLAHWKNQRAVYAPAGYPNMSSRWLTAPNLLIVAPASKIRTGDWEQEARRFFGDDMPNITYISYESLRLMDRQTKRPRHWQFTAARNGGVMFDVIADECHALKNPQSKQSKALLEIKQSGGLFIGLSGTPMPNGWIDFAGYSKLFGFVKGITEFKKNYCIYQDFKGYPELVKYINVDQLEYQLKRVAFKLSRDQAAELPAQRMIGVNIHMDSKTSKLYNTIRLTKKDPRNDELMDNSSRLLSVIRQVTTEARLDNLMSILNDTDDNVIVFYNYISERKAILKLLESTDKNILRYDGDQHDELPASDAQIKNTVLLAHYKSASTGLNLQWANVTVYFSPTYSYQEFEQSIGRTHRNGQTKKCLYYLFNVKSTVDKKVWDCLRNKQDFNAKLWKDDNNV